MEIFRKYIKEEKSASNWSKISGNIIYEVRICCV